MADKRRMGANDTRARLRAAYQPPRGKGRSVLGPRRERGGHAARLSVSGSATRDTVPEP